MQTVEHKSSAPAGRIRHLALPPRRIFYWHLFRNAAASLALVVGSLFLGAWGYHTFAGLGWVDALLNAAMILTGMGPVSALTGTAAKLFATFYALFSGVAFLTFVAVLFAPVARRFLHRFHLDLSGPDDSQ